MLSDILQLGNQLLGYKNINKENSRQALKVISFKTRLINMKIRQNVIRNEFLESSIKEYFKR